MKDFEFRTTKGFCRVCEHATTGKAIVIPFRYGGKNAPVILCAACIKHLNGVANPEVPTTVVSDDDWEPTIRFFRD